MFRTLLGAGLTALLVTACATGGDLYADTDLDNDGLVDRTEFYAGAESFGVFADWDADRDGYLDADEFGFGMNELGLDDRDGFDTWDVDRDGRLTDDELYGGTFEELDRDDDNFLERTEFETGIRMPLTGR